jgi:hypothetical protein
LDLHKYEGDVRHDLVNYLYTLLNPLALDLLLYFYFVIVSIVTILASFVISFHITVESRDGRHEEPMDSSSNMIIVTYL